MKEIPFAVIHAAKMGDIEAAQIILKHFEGYIASKCLCRYQDENNVTRSFANDDLRYRAETALLDALFKFKFLDPPDSFTG